MARLSGLACEKLFKLWGQFRVRAGKDALRGVHRHLATISRPIAQEIKRRALPARVPPALPSHGQSRLRLVPQS